MFDETFAPCYELCGNATLELAVDALEKYIDIVDLNDSKDEWFEKIKSICPLVGCTPNVKEFKQEPENSRPCRRYINDHPRSAYRPYQHTGSL